MGKLLVTSSENIGPRVIFGPRARDQWTYYPAYSLARCVWDIRHLLLLRSCDSVNNSKSHHLLGISFTHSTNVHECPQVQEAGLRVNPGKRWSDRGWPIWLPAVWNSSCGLCTTRVLLFCSGYSGFSIAIPCRTRVLDLVSLDVGVLGRQIGREAKRQMENKSQSHVKIFPVSFEEMGSLTWLNLSIASIWWRKKLLDSFS